MKKLRLLILSFIVFSILSLDLEALFSRQTTLVELEKLNVRVFKIENFKYNVESIAEWLGTK